MPALPALSKSYSTRANVPFLGNSSAELIADSAIWLLKAFLMDQVSTGTLTGTRHANSVWTCVGSSDGTAGAHDGVDRWGSTFDAAKIVHANNGSAHSWIHLRNATLGLDLLIDCASVTPQNVRISATKSSAPFASGTATASPATTSEAFTWANVTDAPTTTSALLADLTLSATFYAHFTVDDSGQFYFLANRSGSGVFNGGVALIRSVGAHASDTRNNFLFGGAGYASGRGWPYSTNARAGGGCTARRATGTAADSSGGLVAVVAGGTYLGDNASITDAFSSVVRFAEVPVWCVDPLAYRGTLPDLYEMIGGGVGASFPTVAAQTWISAGGYLIPFIGTVPLL